MAVYRTLPKGQEAHVTTSSHTVCKGHLGGSVSQGVWLSRATEAQAQRFAGGFQQHLSRQRWLNLRFCLWWVWSVADDSRNIYMSFKMNGLHCDPGLCDRCWGSIIYCLHFCMPGVLRAMGAASWSHPQSLSLELFPANESFFSQCPQPLLWVLGNDG